MVTMEKSSSMEMVDRISTLPEPILHNILSFSEAVETRLLSKTWKQTVSTFPIFEFHDIYDHFDETKVAYFKWRRRKFERTLKKRHRKMLCLTKLTLVFDSDKYPEFIDRCVRYAIEGNVQGLILRPLIVTNFYYLPKMVLHSKSINVLQLKNCGLDFKDVKLFSLRKLCLSNVKLRVDDCQEFTDNLFAGCPLIEHLSIAGCSGLKTIELCGFDKLKEVEIIANRLKRLEIKASCKNINSLTLSQTSIITDEWLRNQIKNLPLLEYLNICDLNKLQRIHISSPRLKTLIIFSCNDLVEAKIETPNLSIFKYRGQMISFSSNCLALSEVDLYIKIDYCAMRKDIQYSRYIKLLKNFNHGTVNLGSRSIEAVIIPENLRKARPSPLSSNVKHLNFTVDTTIYYKDVIFSIFTILDGLLWIAPHVETIVFTQSCWLSGLSREVINQYCFQFSYYEEEFVGCCKSLPVSCWRHCIKEVQVKIYNLLDKAGNAKVYSLEGEEILMKLSSILISDN